MRSMIFSSLLVLASIAAGAPMASLQEVTGFGSNPSNTKMFVYVPDKLATKPAVLVAAHACQNTAASTFGSTPYKGLADQKGFVVIYPQSAVSGTCWDVSSKSSLTHNGGGSSNSIANMVTYSITKYNADASKVFFVGLSSGAMMANVMAATYPELFNAIIVHSGVPAGCFVSASNQVAAWNGTCSGGKTSHTPEEWAAVVKNMYPGYSGSRPRMMVMHGGSDTTLAPNNYNQTIKQWVGVFGLSETPTTTKTNTPESGYTTYLYGNNVKGVYNPSKGHNIPIFGSDDMAWLGL